MNIVEIIQKYLRKNKFDGLAGNDCGCAIDDVGACEYCSWNCEPAVKGDCSTCEAATTKEGCEFKADGGCFKPAHKKRRKKRRENENR